MTTEVKTNPRTDAFGPRNTRNRRHVGCFNHPRILALDGQILKLFRNLANHPLDTLVELFQFDPVSVRKSDGDLTKLVDPSQTGSVDIDQGDTELFDILIDSRRRLLNPRCGCLTVASAPVDPMRVNDCLHDKTPKTICYCQHKSIVGVCTPENSDKFGIHRLILLKIPEIELRFAAEQPSCVLLDQRKRQKTAVRDSSASCRRSMGQKRGCFRRVDRSWYDLSEQALDEVERRE